MTVLSGFLLGLANGILVGAAIVWAVLLRRGILRWRRS